IIEEVAENLDLLPRREPLLAGERKFENVGVAPRVLTPEAREELWNPKPRVEPQSQQPQQPQQQQQQQQPPQQQQQPPPPLPVKPKMFQTEAAAAGGIMTKDSLNGNRNGAGATLNGNGNGNGKYKPFGDLDDEINLEIGETGAFH
ncbi:MAG TPA: hypothetical protein VK400_00270, partial [Pyrinomonadaceae bacterium]|nr:hypothetical protein [Pyrinomonadaceae bacterium]